jgi:hypothetical protein
VGGVPDVEPQHVIPGPETEIKNPRWHGEREIERSPPSPHHAKAIYLGTGMQVGWKKYFYQEKILIFALWNNVDHNKN